MGDAAGQGGWARSTGWSKLLYKLGFRNGQGQTNGKDILCALRCSLVAVRRLDRRKEGSGAQKTGLVHQLEQMARTQVGQEQCSVGQLW